MEGGDRGRPQRRDALVRIIPMAILLRFHHMRLEEGVQCIRDTGDIVQCRSMGVRPRHRRGFRFRRPLRVGGRAQAQLRHVRRQRRQIRVRRARARARAHSSSRPGGKQGQGRRRGAIRERRRWGRLTTTSTSTVADHLLRAIRFWSAGCGVHGFAFAFSKWV